MKLNSFILTIIDEIAQIPLLIHEQGTTFWSQFVMGFLVECRLSFPFIKDIEEDLED